MMNYNTQLFMGINQGAGYYHGLDVLMLCVTHILPYVMVLLVVVYLLVMYPKYHHTPVSKKFRSIQALELIGTLGATLAITYLIKIFVALPRPFHTLTNTVLLVPDQGGFSFPSMHTALTIALATSVYVHHKRLGLFLGLFGLLVGVSRIYVGVHYPVDVLVGAILGWLVARLIHAGVSHIARHTD